MVESANSIILRWDVSGAILFINEYGLEYFGYSQEEVLGENVIMFVPEKESSGRDLTGLVRDIVDYPEKYTRFENENVRRNGERVWVSWTNKAIVDDKGRVIEVLAIGNDITRLKKVEDELRRRASEMEAILSCIPDGVIVYDTRARIINMNEAAKTFLKYPDEDTKEEVVKRVRKHFVVKAEDGRVLEPSEMPAYKVAVDAESVKSQILLLEGHGESRWFIFNASPLVVAGKHLGGILAMLDITSLKQAELLLEEKKEKLQKQNDELVKAKEKAEESDRFKSAFLANISHEIRTPMTGILGFADLLKMPDIPEEDKNTYLQLIEASGQRMLQIINDLIDISKIEAGQLELKSELTNIDNLLNELLLFFIPYSNKKGIYLKFYNQVDPEKMMVMADRTKLIQVMSNLIDNAIKYTHHGSVEFGCRLQSGCLHFYVKDTGIGIRKELHAKIFDRFTQGELSISEKSGGVGLGLSISKAYVELLGGSIQLESEPGNGSVFSFSIPLKFPDVTLGEFKQVSAVNERENRHLSGSKVLIAEDDEGIFMLLKEILRQKNIVSVYAKNGLEAIEKFKSEPDIDLIIMDTKMPRLNGLEATRQIKAINPKVPVIALSAYCTDQDKQNAFEHGCDNYLVKPMERKVLLDTISLYI